MAPASLDELQQQISDLTVLVRDLSSAHRDFQNRVYRVLQTLVDLLPPEEAELVATAWSKEQ